MIKIQRTAIELPAQTVKRVQKSMNELREFFSVPFNDRIQRTAKFDDTIWRSMRPFLVKLFNDKCAYCETRIIGVTGDIDKFRPRLGAINLDKTKFPDYYWWLSYEWENLYLSCQKCNFSKANKFPVEGSRGPDQATLAELRRVETALLLDPCIDDPDQHLAFNDAGMVSPITEPGRVTIEVLSLNRESLVHARELAISSTLEMLKLLKESKKDPAAWIEKNLSPTVEYCAAKNQCVRRFLKEQPAAVRGLGNLTKTVKKRAQYISSSAQSDLDEKFLSNQEQRETARAGSDLGTEFLYTNVQFIERATIHNFRRIEDLTIQFPDLQQDKKPWVILLGENGMGKSSILKAIALTLMSDKKREAYSPRDYLRRGSSEGFVEVKVTGYTKPFRIDFSASDLTFRSDPNVFHSPFFCYGGTRLLPNKKTRRKSGTDDYSRVSNLFNPFLPLTDAKASLLRMKDEPFGLSARAIKGLLTQDDENMLVRLPPKKPTEIFLRPSSEDTGDTLAVLSDGFQSVIALAMDILEIMLKHYDSVEDCEGVVLIDEIDVHLHPRWKIQIVGLLRKVFPRVQFVITTHDPLCLLGSLPGEVHILRSNLTTGKIEAIQHDVPPGTSADQVLTGFWFGLRSTLDDGTLEMLDRHRDLLRQAMSATDPDANDVKERLELETALRQRLGTYADTSVDMMAQAVASEFKNEEVEKIDWENVDAIRGRFRAKLREFIDKAGD